MKFAHLEHEKTVFDWQGSQVPYMAYDELTHFSRQQFFYMLSRNRSGSGVRGYVRGSCNPDPDSFVRQLIDWWIGPDGYAIPERSGVLRWFVILEDQIHWANSKEELHEKFGHGDSILPKSFTFIPSNVHDNKILLQKDPGYLANLMALPRIDRLRLLGGNWNVRPTAGMFFQRSWFPVIDAMPANVIRRVRAWDKAATKPTPENPDPDWTRGVKLAKLSDGRIVIEHVTGCRDTPLAVERLVRNTATQDGHGVTVSIAQDPGSAGVADADNFTRLLMGYPIVRNKPSRDKITRCKPLSAQCEAGNVLVLRGEWNEEFFSEVESFDGEDGHKDDIVDAASDGFNELCSNVSILNVL